MSWGYKILCFFDVFFKSPHFLHTSVVSCRGGYLHRTYVRFFLSGLWRFCGFFVNHLTEHMFDISNLHNFSIFDGAAARSPIRDFSVNPRPIRHTQIFPKTAAQNFIRDYLKILHLTKTQFYVIIKVTVNFFIFF